MLVRGSGEKSLKPLEQFLWGMRRHVECGEDETGIFKYLKVTLKRIKCMVRSSRWQVELSDRKTDFHSMCIRINWHLRYPNRELAVTRCFYAESTRDDVEEAGVGDTPGDFRVCSTLWFNLFLLKGMSCILVHQVYREWWARQKLLPWHLWI